MAARIIVALGALITAGGMLLPILTIPLVGPITLFTNGQLAGYLALAVTFVTLFTGASRYVRFAWIPAVLSAIVLGFFGLQASNRANEAMATFRENLENSPFGALAGDFVGTVEFDEGWVVMAVGIVISAAGSLAAKRPAPKD